MEHDIEHIKKGDVVYVPFPLDDLDKDKTKETTQAEQNVEPRKKKDRPALVLWQAEINTFTVCPITSKPYREHKIQLSGNDLDSGKMTYEPSFIRPNIVTTLHKKYIRKKIGTLKAKKLKEVIDKVKEFLDAEPEEAPVPKALERVKRIR